MRRTDLSTRSKPYAKIGATSVPPKIFDDDYLYFYEEILGDERSDADTELIARLLSLPPGAKVLDVPCGEGRIAGRLAQRGYNVVGSGRRRKLEYWLEQVHASELVERLRRAGFDDVWIYGQDGGPFDPAGRRLIALAAGGDR